MSRKMKDSGIEWIGKIPDDCKILQLRLTVNNINEKNNPIKFNNILSLTNTKGVIPYGEKGNQGNVSKEDVSQYKLAYKDTIIINSMNLKIGSVGYCNYNGCVSPVYYVLKNKRDYNLKFINYIFQSDFQKYLGKYGKGILEIREKISMYDVLHSYIPIPNIYVQENIANYLDKKVSKIDETIENNKRSIELLEEYKKSVINKSVISKNNWKKVRIKNISYLKGRIGWQGLKTNDYKEEGPYLITGTDFENGKINWESCVHISEERYEEDSNIHINNDDLLITKDGTIGKLAIVEYMPYKATLNSGVMLIRINNEHLKYINKYLYYVLQSDIFKSWYESNQKGNATIKHLYQEQFYNFQFYLPDIDEQKNIFNKLDNVIKIIDTVINYRQQIIEKLEEYKKSLIYEVVTGKKEV